jgi:hypothetical protein
MLDHSIMIIAICVMRGCSVRRNKFTFVEIMFSNSFKINWYYNNLFLLYVHKNSIAISFILRISYLFR